MPSLRHILGMDWRAPLVPVCILDPRSTFVCCCFRVPGTNCLGMGSPCQRPHGSHGSIYHGFRKDEDSGSDGVVVPSSGDDVSACNEVHCRFCNAHKSSQQRRRATREHLCADQATQTHQYHSKSSYIFSTLTPSIYSKSPSTIATSLNTTHVEHGAPYRTHSSKSPGQKDCLEPFIPCSRNDSAIELHTMSPIHSHRYPPGIVVIKRLDEQGKEVIEETDLTHQNTPFSQMKPAVIVRDEHTGVVQSTQRAGLMERAWERMADALAIDDG